MSEPFLTFQEIARGLLEIAESQPVERRLWIGDAVAALKHYTPTSEEERKAWDRYAAATLSGGRRWPAAAEADELLAERRKRFGGQAP